MKSCSRSSLLILLLASLGSCTDPGSESPPLVIFAAASLREVTAEVAESFAAEYPEEIVFNFAGSNVLAQQILAAPGADVFLSADLEWLDQVAQAGRLHGETRRAVLSNRLVLIGHRGADLAIADPGGLATGRYRFLALADPQAVPAGRYAQAMLLRIAWGEGSLWDRVAERVVPTLDVRAALAMVEAEPESVGIVYRSDVSSSRDVEVLYTFPELDDVPITYGGAVVRDGARGELARQFLDFFAGPAGRAASERYGFGPLPALAGASR